jgi:hypothetical protein
MPIEDFCRFLAKKSLAKNNDRVVRTGIGQIALIWRLILVIRNSNLLFIINVNYQIEACFIG